MHDYAIFGHDRSSIGRWLGIASLLISSALSQLIIYLHSLSGLQILIGVTIATGAIYFALDWVFNNSFWRYKVFASLIPNLNGKWNIEGRTLDENGNSKYDWEGSLGIVQTWKTINISLKTQKSQSDSYTATLQKLNTPDGGWRLSYSYCNTPELSQSAELKSHKGFCEIEFDKNFSMAAASYFNSGGRRTYGDMKLRKEIDD
ncbi:MAG: hypothetical protein ACRBBR_08820 [Cellvibrionaceae bacterium]